MDLHKNISTAVESDKGVPLSASTSKQSTPSKKKKKHKKHGEKKTIDFSVLPGVHKIILNEATQGILGAVVGHNVTTEKPWIDVDKELIKEDMGAFGENSVFAPLKDLIEYYPGQQLLFGYIPDESKDEDEFYICMTEPAADKVREVTAKIQRIQEEKLKNAIHKRIKHWESLGSEKEIEECAVKYHRPLIEVEIESKYPILPFKIQFRQTKSQSMRDGYMELRPGEDAINVIVRRRIDADIQVAPSVQPNEAQTYCTYPSNSYTQYEYEVPPEITISEELKKGLQEYSSDDLANFLETLRVNQTIDLYRNDYEKLIVDPKFTTKVKHIDYKDYYCFINMDLCGSKMISSLCFHPTWSGIFVAAYVDIAPSLYITGMQKKDEVLKAVYDSNPVLMWGFNDDLTPKLILETQRDVYSLSFCPYDENLLIGGCLNGQIILWDISNKLNRVEEEEILTINQQKYREYMFSLMDWMKNIFNLSFVRPAALSDLKYSHKGCVQTIMWLSRYHTVSKTGKFQELDDDEKLSVQFATAAEDGTLLIWDLLRKPATGIGGFKAVRKMRRLKKKPSALACDESPYKLLHLNLRPVYKINIRYPMPDPKIAPVSAFFSKSLKVHFEQVDTDSKKCLKLSDRVFFKATVDRENTSDEKSFYVGTMMGEYMQISWEGQEFDSGEVVNYEDCIFTNRGRVHDGPVVSCEYSHLNRCILTVGGKVFALWREDFPGRPIIWRKSSEIYTFGCYGRTNYSLVKLVRIDGYYELWKLAYRSKTPITVRLMSNGAISAMHTHPRKIKRLVFGLCDYRGAFRMFHAQHDEDDIVAQNESENIDFVEREIKRKTDFLAWQSDFKTRYENMLKMMTPVEPPKEPVFEKEKTDKKQKVVKTIAKVYPGQRYLENAKEEQEKRNQEEIKKIILEKKQMQIDDLLRKREPIMKLEEELEIKRKKQRSKLKDSDKIFYDTVAMLFPDIFKPKPVPPPNPYEDTKPEEVRENAFNRFQNIAAESQDYIDAHPFIHDFNWKEVLKTGRAKRRRLGEGLDDITHYKRYAKIKDEKAAELARINAENRPKEERTIILDDEDEIVFDDAEEEALEEVD